MGSYSGRSHNQKNSKFPWDLWPLRKCRGLASYPFPSLAEERRKETKDGSYSFFGDFLCPRCGQKSEFMVLEFHEPSSELMAAWEDIKVEEIDEDILHCPKCDPMG